MPGFETPPNNDCLWLFVVNVLISVFGEQRAMWTVHSRSLYELSFLHTLTLPSSGPAMAENLRFLRTLQIISETARKINPSARPIHKISNTTTILKSLPEHRSLLPILLSHDIPSKLAKACADRYDKYASELRSRTESKLTPYLINRDGGQPARVYAVFLKNYKQALRNWSQTVLNTVLKSLKRDSVQLHDWEVAYPPPLWLPVRVLRLKLTRC